MLRWGYREMGMQNVAYMSVSGHCLGEKIGILQAAISPLETHAGI